MAKDKIAIVDAISEEDHYMAENMDLMLLIKQKSPDAPRIILTTIASAVGVTFYPHCYVIMTEVPGSWPDYLQAVGRSNRVEPEGPKLAALVA